MLMIKKMLKISSDLNRPDLTLTCKKDFDNVVDCND
jgi:hypothetical protein